MDGGLNPPEQTFPPRGGRKQKREYAGIKWQNIQAMNNNCIKRDKNNVKHTEKSYFGYVFWAGGHRPMVDGKGMADEEGKNCCGFAYGRLCIL